MALPKKGTRTIVVDGRRFRWNMKYEKVNYCSAACPVRLTVQQDVGRGGQKLIAQFDGVGVSDSGVKWMFPRYGAEVTPGKVADIIRAGLVAGWYPEATGQPPVVLDGEPFLRLPDDPSSPPPGSKDDMKRRFMSELNEQILTSFTPPSSGGSDGGSSSVNEQSAKPNPNGDSPGTSLPLH
jgi:hypothetical protein